VLRAVHTWQPSSRALRAGGGQGVPVPQRDAARLVLWVSTVCCAWELLPALSKRAVLSPSTGVSVGEMTLAAYLCAQALLHGFRAGMLTALGDCPSVPSSCDLSLEATQARGSCAQQHVPTCCLNDVALF